tara:strand:+ start:953 stop:1276 length:324 start_codon:yes stop_codon:yes gene_type:complete
MSDPGEVFVLAVTTLIILGGLFFILGAHSFLNRLIDEGKIEGPSTGELQAEMLGWLVTGRYSEELNERDIRTAARLSTMLKMIVGTMLLLFVLFLSAILIEKTGVAW